ncbi:CAP domain-containing protein [Sutcliffiella horikoshii]|uniref:CAP domain-containing protein n=1 Tax=Sutcliffiella horikoshii TaxID=79883 RepID=UPI002040AAB6|nr:CAP domain-containing protein [Sutcliffiella horikoshii]MCM3616000.1 CAP domain-containing protein [Sutcliffiella horikoshii]
MKKLVKITTIIAFALSLMVGCNNNSANDNLDTNNTAFNDNGYGNGITNVRNDTNARGQGQSADVQEIHNGYLTIDQNSFSTSIPSEKFPHVEKFQQQGPFAIYKFQEQEAPQGQPEQGQAQEAPQGQPEQRKAPQNEQAAPQENQPAEEPAEDNQQQTQESTEGISETEMKVIELTNAERRKNGLSDLKADASLSNVARDKSKDMQTNNYFSHTSPTHGSPFDMMRDYGISYNTAGENIAMGQRSPEEVVQAWMDSEGHRKNILNGEFTHIGVGYVEEGNYWTQMFIGK